MTVIAGKYEVLKELGRGGYGRVYLVRHRDLGIEFALKELNRSLSENPSLVESFRQEAELLSRFSHRGSAQLRDFGKTEEGLYYMTLDFCEGETLEVILRRDQWLPTLLALEVAAQSLEVISAAHQFGIIHRDIKPGNFIMKHNPDGTVTVKLVDFGIAKLLQNREIDHTAGFGTPQYMSPEQAAGEKSLDHRIDIYAMGVVLYEMITGVAPFQGDSVVSILIKHLTQPPPPFAAGLGVPPEVEALVFKALSKERDKRFQSAEEFRAECDAMLERLLSGPEPVVSTGVHKRFISEMKSGAVHAPPSETPTILCLDDDPMVLNIIEHLLRREGFRVFTAHEFTVIHDLIFREGCNLMLCDVEMPGIPGPKVCEMLKQEVPGLQIVLFSNIPERDLEKLAQQSRADSWLSKGRRPDEWIETVKRLVGR